LSGSRVVPFGQTDGCKHMTKPIVGFRNFANALKNRSVNNVKGNNHCLFSDPHKTHTLYRQNMEFVNVKPGGIYSNQWVLNNQTVMCYNGFLF